ncbi:MAG: response regulator [Alphaproteobacteria bacterium]|nr:response regulator [Alphaproteobacteria bacterium]
MARILIIEDMKGVRDALEIILSMAGHQVVSATNGSEGMEKIDGGTYDLVITDILMPEVDGTEVIMHAKEKSPSTPVVAISAGGNSVSVEQALMFANHKADAVMEKPFSKDELLAKVNELAV